MKTQFFTLLLLCVFGTAQGAALEVGKGKMYLTIRQAFEAAMDGDTLLIHPGVYAEGNLKIEKQLTLLGIDYPVLEGRNSDEIITVTVPYVGIFGLQIQNSGQLNTIDLAGIKVLSTHHVRIGNNRMRNCNFAIYLSNVQDSEVFGNDVQGTPKEEQNTGNGIHLWKCERARIEKNYCTGHRDGIYFEFVTDSDILNNLSEKNIRYGLHFMFSHNDRYRENTFQNNGAGVAVMYSRQVEMTNNHFEHNWGAAAYGLLLKDISDSRIRHNYFKQNTAGIYMEGASRIDVEQNRFEGNGWALRVQASCDANNIRENIFIGNSFDVATNGHLVLNKFEGNYWDKYEGYDLNRDGVGDVPFRPVSLYAVIVERMPFCIVLMRSFMVYMLDKAEKIMPSLTPEMLLDEKPLMREPQLT